MNQIQQLIDSSRDAPHDAIIAAGIFAIPVLIALWIVNRMRHPERGFLHALVIASVGFVLVPCVSSAVLILWVRTGGDSIQATCVSIFLFFVGFWAFRPRHVSCGLLSGASEPDSVQARRTKGRDI